MNETFDQTSIGIKVNLLTDYAVVCETLERIGIVNRKDKKIFPSCYCHKMESATGDLTYSICHFKELFLLHGKPSTFNKIDKLRLKTIVYFLQRWNLIKVINKDDLDKILQDKIDVVPFSQKNEYQIVHKFKHTTKPSRNDVTVNVPTEMVSDPE